MSFFGDILKSAAIAAALITAPLAANAITVSSSGLVENTAVAFSVGDIFTADLLLRSTSTVAAWRPLA